MLVSKVELTGRNWPGIYFNQSMLSWKRICLMT